MGIYDMTFVVDDGQHRIELLQHDTRNVPRFKHEPRRADQCNVEKEWSRLMVYLKNGLDEGNIGPSFHLADWYIKKVSSQPAWSQPTLIGGLFGKVQWLPDLPKEKWET